MGFFDWLGDTVGKVWSGIKDTASTVYNTVKSGVNWVADKVQPIVKGVADYASYIPVIGAPISGVASQINKGIDMAKKGVDWVGNIGSAVGATVDKFIPQQRAFRRPELMNK